MNDRRDILKLGAAAFTTAIFTGNVKGANDRIRVSFIGTGRQGQGNMGSAMAHPEVEVVSVCDVYQPNLEKAVARSARGPNGEPGARPAAKAVKDFRDVLADKSIDAVCIASPDHWHAYMAVEACKAGKDVYVEKPISVTIDEGRKMVQAARKYDRVVQVGTQQRSGVHFQKATQLVKDGALGKVTFIRTFNYGNDKPEGIGNPPDSAPPNDLDWQMWLGPAPDRPFNRNRFGVDPNAFSHFRWFWDYAGGMMTDWGVHVLDIAQMAFDEPAPRAVTALGGKYNIKDNRDTPDTLQVTYEYPNGMIATYENRMFNGNSLFGKSYGTIFHGEKGTLFVDRANYTLYPEKGSPLQEETVQSSNNHGRDHWRNFLDCIKSRKRPNSDIEIGHRSTSTALLGNIALRTGLRIDWNGDKETAAQPQAKPYLERNYRKPWELKV
ncbi:MAG TPA: Gfo/Idh/MocA family oxidoreductase [Bryobacteraceae bacterium]|nr:Gfo/Idh/MocA family oxidoreductase [Bryobacteraceae bacterium]